MQNDSPMTSVKAKLKRTNLSRLLIDPSHRLGSFVHIGGLLDVNSAQHGKNECL
jgi:hypothetical protein